MLKNLKWDANIGRFTDETGCSWETKADYMFMGVLPSCGCGDPESIGVYVRDMLLEHVKQTGAASGIECWDRTSYDDMPVMFFLSWADSQDYIDHGTTIRCSWMTEKGDELLRDLDDVITQDPNHAE